MSDTEARGHAEERDGIRDAELAEVLGVPRTRCEIEAQTHNPRNAVTAGVWRIRSASGSAVLKLLARGPAGGDWGASEDPRHWNYWRREACLYGSELRERLAGTGLGLPRLRARFERSPQRIALWLEDVEGRGGDTWELADHRATARALGRFHARARPLRDAPWASRNFLRDYPDTRAVDASLLDCDATWALPLVAETLGPEVRRAGHALHAERERMRRALSALPRVFSHLDFWPMNLIRRPGGEVVAFDWGFCGDGAVGEDLGNHVPDSALDHFVPAAELPVLDRACFAAYLEGLADAGWQGDERALRLGVCGAAVKYHWLLPLMLGRARSGRHAAYGGESVGDLHRQYRERGRVICFLAGWLEEAMTLV